jgi:hypothetical protein
MLSDWGFFGNDEGNRELFNGNSERKLDEFAL